MTGVAQIDSSRSIEHDPPRRRTLPIAVVIPAFNERHTIAEVVRRTRPYSSLLFVVDDGSADDTRRILEDLPVTLIRHDGNRGKGASLVSGFEAALSLDVDAVVTIDGDLQHAPEEIPRLVAAAREHPDSLIIGSRFERKGRIPLHRKAANRFANFWISIACRRKIKDSQSGFRLYPRRLLETVAAQHDRKSSFVFESEILINAARANFSVQFISIDPIYLATPYRHSHYRAVHDTVLIFLMVARKILTG